MESRLECALCHKTFMQLTGHIFHTHRMSIEEYRAKFPKDRIGVSLHGEQNPMYGKKRGHPWNYGLTKETDKRLAIVSRKVSKTNGDGRLAGGNNPNYGNHKLAGKNHPNYGKHLSEETKKRQSVTLSDGRLKGTNHPNYGGKFHGKRWWEIEGHIPPACGKTRSAKTKKRNSDSHKKLWADPESAYHSDEYWEKRRIGENRKPSNLEICFKDILDKHFENDWIYVGDGTFRISDNGKFRIPDFKHRCFNILIEVYFEDDYRKIRNYGSIRRYKLLTTRFYHLCGYQVIYFSDKDIHRHREKVASQIRHFVELNGK